MSDIAVEVSHVWKRFHRGEFHDSLRDLIPAAARRLLGRGRRRDELGKGDFWAVKDVSFQVKQGEVLGVIGPNGAGKSTLLKILSKILKPTRGSIRVNGRLRALIEVGAGFHGDLTGRENVYLNGAILGLTKREIDARFDEIVDFAGIEPFLDTPVKRYSSGMYARLGFAVAAHLEPEILLVDEVLAVGDAQFQKKCLGKMQNVASQGRTVLFVSHNMGAIKMLCHSAILLEGGRLVRAGDAIEVVNGYIGQQDQGRVGLIPDHASRLGTGAAKIRKVVLTGLQGAPVSDLFLGQAFRIQLEIEVIAEVLDAHFDVNVSTSEGIVLTCSPSLDMGEPARRLTPGAYVAETTLNAIFLPHDYTLDLHIHHTDGTTIDYVQRTLVFSVLRISEGRDGHYPWIDVRGYLRVPTAWRCQRIDAGPAGSGEVGRLPAPVGKGSP
jgi:lipopolysaccharide transport system ATP-binding protein